MPEVDSVAPASSATRVVSPTEAVPEKEKKSMLENMKDGFSKKPLLAAARSFIEQKGNGRYNRLRDKLKGNEEEEEKNDSAMLYIAATDLTFVEGKGLTLEMIHEAMRRREAWTKYPYQMTGIALAQIVLCILSIITVNAPLNTSTLIMGAIYVMITATANPFDVTCDLRKILMKQINNKGTPVIVACVLLSPIIFFVFSITVVFDFLVGRILDNTFGSVINIVVQCITIVTAVSIGLRSGDPISAIQTFAGFEFIAGMDEAFVATVHFDTSQYVAIPSRKDAKFKKAICRVLLYTLIPLLVAGSAYLTLTNRCLAWCDPLPEIVI